MALSSAILGLSAYYHDSAAALLINGEIIAAAQEERFSRKKHDPRFPALAVQYVLQEAGFDLEEVDSIIFYEKPFLKFERILENYHAFVPRGIKGFLTAIPSFMSEKLFLRRTLAKELKKIGKLNAPIQFAEHHLSHAASAFFPSPFADAAILTIDGVGEWTTTMIASGKDNEIKVLKELHYPHSLGLLYSAFTFYLGFKVNSGEYKLMGLSPYASIKSPDPIRFAQIIKDKLIDIRDDGSFLLNMEYFSFGSGLQMTHDEKWKRLFGLERRLPETGLKQAHADLALSIQIVTEEIVIKLAATAKALTGSSNLVMAGGVALNCVANEKLLQKKIFENIWVQPAAGDAGGALGAAYAAHYIKAGAPRFLPETGDAMQGAFLGPLYSSETIRAALLRFNLPFVQYDDKKLVQEAVASLMRQEIVGWFQGRMEFGPRALGNRSILADPRSPGMQSILNEKIKFREGFRPFAPCITEEQAAKYFNIDRPSPYMLFTAPLLPPYRKPLPESFYQLDFSERLKYDRSAFPAITHLDFSARAQTVNKTLHPLLYRLLTIFNDQTGCPMLVNTSFNRRGEPMVCSPADAIDCFLNTDIDMLVMGNFIVRKSGLKDLTINKKRTREFEPD